MSRVVYTNCSSLTVNCVLYQELGLINLWGAGKYYDGTTCWVVNSSGVITGTAICLTNVTINIGTGNTADGSGNITVFAWTTGNVNVDTNVTVQFQWGGLGSPPSYINSSVIIYSGNYCSGGISIGGATSSESTDFINIASLTPTYSTTQNYLQGSGTYPVTVCP